MLDWLLKLIGRSPEPPPPQCALPNIRVAHDERIVSVRDDKGRVALIKWADVANVQVAVVRIETGNDLSWMLSGRDGRDVLAVPMGADGERDFVRAMQARFAGFDNMAVVEALSSPRSGDFQVWPPESDAIV